MTGWSTQTGGAEITRFQNNIQSIFSRVRLLYGATPLEDVINYNVIVRALTEWTGTGQQMVMDQETVSDGVGGITWGVDTGGRFGVVNVRQKYIQGIDTVSPTTPSSFSAGSGSNNVPNNYLMTGAVVQGNNFCTRRYQINLALGMFTQDKLIPTKWMASQLAIEFTLENPDACIITEAYYTTPGSPPTYTVGNINLIPEILEFDASYDAMFLRGLREGGV